MWTLGYPCEFNKILMPLKEVQDIDPMNLGSSLGYLPVNMASRTPMASCQANCHFPSKTCILSFPLSRWNFAAATLVSHIWSPLSISTPPVAVSTAQSWLNRRAPASSRRKRTSVSSCTQSLGLDLVGLCEEWDALLRWCQSNSQSVHFRNEGSGVSVYVTDECVIPICTCVLWIFWKYTSKMMGKMSLPPLQNVAPIAQLNDKKQKWCWVCWPFHSVPVTFMAVGSYFSKTFAIRFLLIMQRSIVDFPIVDGWTKTNKRWVSCTFWGCYFPWVMRLCDFCWGGFANVEFAKFASWKFSTWPLDLRMHPEKKKINIPIPSILWYIYPTFTIKTVKCK